MDVSMEVLDSTAWQQHMLCQCEVPIGLCRGSGPPSRLPPQLSVAQVMGGCGKDGRCELTHIDDDQCLRELA